MRVRTISRGVTRKSTKVKRSRSRVRKTKNNMHNRTRRIPVNKSRKNKRTRRYNVKRAQIGTGGGGGEDRRIAGKRKLTEKERLALRKANQHRREANQLSREAWVERLANEERGTNSSSIEYVLFNKAEELAKLAEDAEAAGKKSTQKMEEDAGNKFHETADIYISKMKLFNPNREKDPKSRGWNVVDYLLNKALYHYSRAKSRSTDESYRNDIDSKMTDINDKLEDVRGHKFSYNWRGSPYKFFKLEEKRLALAKIAEGRSDFPKEQRGIAEMIAKYLRHR